jgi:type IV pilus assembly protein PilN
VIKINLIREGGRAAVRGAGAPGLPAAAAAPTNINNVLIVGLLLLGLLVGGGYWLLKNNELKRKEQLIAERTAEAQKLEAIIKEVEDFQRRKDLLEKRIALINELKRNQKGPVQILDRISRDLPDLVWLESMAVDANRIVLNGRALHPNAVALFVTNIKSDPLFEEPSVGSIVAERVGSADVFRFDMNFAFRYPAEPAAAGGEAVPGGAPAAPGR